MLPPQEDGWSYIKRDPAKTEFGKMGAKEGQSIAGMVVLSEMPIFQSEKEFLEFISQQRRRDSGNLRYEFILNEETISHEKNTTCVRFHTKYKDFGAKNLPKTSPYLIIEDYGVNCIHGIHYNVGVTVALSQRSKPEDADQHFETLSDEFIKNVEFKAIEE